MTRIERDQWLPDSFALALDVSDILRLPETGAERQTQIEHDEVVRVLGHTQDFSLVMKYDTTVGWIRSRSLREEASIKDFRISTEPRKAALEFLTAWIGTPYLWGGLTRKGIDCSGFTEKYFLEVHGRLIPKNSRDQRKISRPRADTANLHDIQDHDLIFCHRRDRDTHHVGIFLGAHVWHARLEQGVVKQALVEFRNLYEIEAVGSVL